MLKQYDVFSQTGLEFKAEEDDQIRIPPEYTRAQFSPYCFDAVWTLAYALNQTMQGVNLEDSKVIKHHRV